MDPASSPETIRTIIDQAEGLGLRGAFTYIGAQDFRYLCAQAEGEYRSGFRSRLTSASRGGYVKVWRVNDGSLAWKRTGHRAGVESVAFDPTGGPSRRPEEARSSVSGRSSTAQRFSR